MMVYVGADSDFYDNSEYQVSAFTLKQLRKALVDPYGAMKGQDTFDLDSAGMHLCVCVDTLNTTGAFIYDIQSLSMNEEELDFDYLPEPAAVLGERDTSDPNSLAWFIDYAMDHYPAKKNVLFVKNGHAWCGACPDFDQYWGIPWEQVQEADTEMMAVEDIANILSSGFGASEDASRDIDVLVFDGDNMASFEVAYELRNAVDYFVASQQDVPLDGFPYYLTLSRMIAETGVSDDPEVDDLTPRDLASRMCDDYLAYYNQTDGKKQLLPHLLADSTEANIAASAFQMVNELGENNMELIADSFLKVIRYMLTGEGKTENGVTDVTDSFPDSDLWDWIPIHRNAIASARDFALLGKQAEQQGYEWLPDMQSWVTYLQAYLWEFADDWGWEKDQDLRYLGMAFKETLNNSRVGLARSLIYDRYWDCGCNPEGLNFWFPQNWLHWDEMDVCRDRVYGYDVYGSLIELPREYYCVNCPWNYSEMGYDFVMDIPGYTIPESDQTSLWMQFYDIYYDSRWLLYYSGEGLSKPNRWK